jgi:hypothetical protein
MDPTFRLLVVNHKGRCCVFTEAALKEAQKSLKPEQFHQLEERGQWREVWLREPLAEHEEEINRLSQVRDPDFGFRQDASLLPAARAFVLVEKWNGFPESPSIEAYRRIPLSLAKVIDNKILEHMYPSGLDAGFFDA